MSVQTYCTCDGAYLKMKAQLAALQAELARELQRRFDGNEQASREHRADVSALVGALTELCDEIDKHEIHAAISETSIHWFKRKARNALANQQEKSK